MKDSNTRREGGLKGRLQARLPATLGDAKGGT
jgi:hypothetical protein